MANYTLSVKATGDTSSFQKAFQTAQKAIDSFEAKFSGFGKKIGSIGDSLTNKITKPAATATSALAGITLVKGFDRLVGIDSAKAKLRALGHDAESVETIMNSALESVKGTAFGLDEAATVAANAVAAGIKPGEELTKYLTMTADAASIAGISMSEMGSIMNKVQTGQTVYTEDLEQLADRGLPVYQWLAEEAGVAASEVKSLASEGQISSQMLYDAINKNVGGAAKIMGETSFSAAIDNIGASIGRIGANFLDAGGKGGGFFSQLKPLMAEFNENLGSLETKASDLGVKFGEAFANIVQKARDLKAQFDALPEPLQGLIIKASGIGAAIAVGIGPALKIVGPLVSSFGTLAKVIGLVASPIGLVVTAIAALAAGFTYLMQTNDGFRNAVMGMINSVLPSIQTMVSTIGSALVPVFQTLATVGSEIVSGLMPGFSAVIANLIPVVVQLVTTFSQLAGQVLPIVMSIIQQLAPFLGQLASLIGQIMAILAPVIAQLISSLLPVITNIVTVIMNIVQAAMPAIIAILNVVMSIIQAIAPVIANILSVVISVVSAIISAISPIISFIGTVISTIISIISPIVTFIANIIATVIQVIGTIIGVISEIFSTVFSIVSGVWNKIAGFISTVIDKVGAVISAISSTVSTVFNKIYSIVSSIMGKVRSFITSVFSGIKTAWNGLTGFVSGIFDGIAGAVKSLVSKVKGVINKVIGGINAAIGLINKIPGVNIGKISYLLHGTDNWQGGFAIMNEGGRGELVNLPNGSQVIPHDVSVKYAKESARANAAADPIDLSGLMDGMIIQIVNNTSVDGTPLRETMSDYVIKKIGKQQKATRRSGGAFAW